MRSLLTYLVLILITLVFHSCSKEVLTSDEIGTPIFYLNVNINGQIFDEQAGNNDYYMYTSYEVDEANTLKLIGSLKQVNASESCPRTFTFEIRHSNNETPTEIGSTDDVLDLGAYEYYSKTSPFDSTKYTYTFTNKSFFVGDSPFYWWDFENNFEDNTAEESPTVVVYSPIVGSVALEIYENDNNQNLLTKNIKSFAGNDPCQLSLTHNNDTENPIFTAIPSGGDENYTYHWEIFDEESPTLHISEQDLSSATNFCVIVTDETDCSVQATSSANACLHVAPPAPPSTDFSYYHADFDFTIEEEFIPDPNFDPIQVATIAIEYIDENGTIYRSDVQPQGIDGNNVFQIWEYEDFDLNENDEKTKRLELNFACDLFNEDGSSSIRLSGGRGFIGVAHP